MTLVVSLPPAIVIALLVSTVLPLLVGLVTRTVTHGGVKAVLLAGLASIAGLLSELLASINSGTAFDVGLALIVALGSFLIAVGMHYGLWKPTGTSTAVQSFTLSKGSDGTYR